MYLCDINISAWHAGMQASTTYYKHEKAGISGAFLAYAGERDAPGRRTLLGSRVSKHRNVFATAH